VVGKTKRQQRGERTKKRCWCGRRFFRGKHQKPLTGEGDVKKGGDHEEKNREREIRKKKAYSSQALGRRKKRLGESERREECETASSPSVGVTKEFSGSLLNERAERASSWVGRKLLGKGFVEGGALTMGNHRFVFRATMNPVGGSGAGEGSIRTKKSRSGQC